MKYVLFFMLLIAGAVHAQDVGSTATAGSQSQSGAQAGASNLGNTQQLGITTISPDHITVHQVPPIALGGAAAGFASENCGNTVQGAAGTLIFSVAKGDIKESNPCNMRRDAFMFYTLANSAKTATEYAALRGMANLAACSSDPRWEKACKQLGLIK